MGFLAAGALLFLCGAYAVYAPAPKVAAETSAQVDLVVEIADVLSLSVNGNADADVEINYGATDIGNFKHETATVVAATNNGTGYTLSFSDKDNSNELVHEVNATYTIPPVTTPMAAANFADNTWGFAVGVVSSSSTLASDPVTSGINAATASDALIYHPVPILSTPLELDKTTKPGERTYPIDYGVKTSTTIPGGKYADSMIFTLVANYVPPVVKALENYAGAYIQDVDLGAICAATPTPSAFLANGTTINTEVPEAELIDKRDGEPYLVRKLADGNCWMAENLRLGKNVGVTLLTADDSDVSQPCILPQGSSGAWGASATVEGVYVRSDRATTNYGNLYSFQAATAGTGGALASGDATSSICPKGMKLPMSSGATSYQNLFATAYQIPIVASNQDLVLAKPFSFTLDGFSNGASISIVGSMGHAWTSTVTNAGNAAILRFGNSNFQTSYSYYKYGGFGVRCVVAGL